jgi:hypothetical protein
MIINAQEAMELVKKYRLEQEHQIGFEVNRILVEVSDIIARRATKGYVWYNTEPVEAVKVREELCARLSNLGFKVEDYPKERIIVIRWEK